MSDKDGWRVAGPHRELPRERVESVVAEAMPGRSIRSVERVAGGFSNANYRVVLAGGSESLLVRGCVRSAAAARKEADLYAMLRGRVPVPEVVHFAPGSGPEEAPCLVLRWIDGISLCDLRRGSDPVALGQAAYSVGRVLVEIGAVTFERPGFLGPGLAIEQMGSAGADTTVGFIEACSRSEVLGRRAGPRLADRVLAFLDPWRERARLFEEQARLVHSDFNSRNILVNGAGGTWAVAGVIDWEFAFSGSPLFDVGNLLRYERGSRPVLEPNFSRGYREAGGELPEDWRTLARVGDLTALCEFLTRPELDDSIADEVIGLITATIEDREAP